MQMRKQLFGRVFAGILFASVMTIATSTWGGAPSLEPADRMARYSVTARDVEDIDRALADAFKNLSEIWARIFAENRLTYRNPALKRYVSNNFARCGTEYLPVNNAYYCQPDDVIWYDPIFLARVKKTVADRSKQSADAVPVVVVAHEWGHAVAARLGYGKRTVGTSVESDADCYAGAATRELINSRRLPVTAIRETEQMFELLAEPDSRATGSFADSLFRSHGVKSERKLAFNFGADSGIKSCQNEKRYYDTLRKVQRPIK
jgi:predicted metalloprotease